MKNAHLLNQCTPSLRTLFQRVEAIIQVDVLPSTIRTLEQQKAFFARGVSTTMNSMHLITPENPQSRAVDAGPYPMKWPQELDFTLMTRLPRDRWEAMVKEWVASYWKDWARLYYFAGVVKAVAFDMGIKVRYGGDWNGNFDLKDQNFYDAVHYEQGGV